MKSIILTPQAKCKCPCNKYIGSNGSTYWYNHKHNIVYYTDYHKPNPVKAIGTFLINDQKIIQSLTQ